MFSYGIICRKCHRKTRRFMTHDPCIWFITATCHNKPISQPVGKTKNNRRSQASSGTRTIKTSNLLRTPSPNHRESTGTILQTKTTAVRITSPRIQIYDEKILTTVQIQIPRWRVGSCKTIKRQTDILKDMRKTAHQSNTINR